MAFLTARLGTYLPIYTSMLKACPAHGTEKREEKNSLFL